MLYTSNNDTTQERVEPINERPNPEVVAKKKAEIAKRYKDRSKNRDRSKDWLHYRIAELERLFERRCRGRLLPEHDDAALDYLHIVADHIVQLSVPYKRMTAWAGTWAPWFSAEQCDALIEGLLARKEPKKWKAPALGKELNLTLAERTELKIQTFRDVGWSARARERLEHRKKQKKEWASKARRKAGAKPRDESAARTKPWVPLDISERTYYRWLKLGKLAEVMPVAEVRGHVTLDTACPRTAAKSGGSNHTTGTGRRPKAAAPSYCRTSAEPMQSSIRLAQQDCPC